MSHSAAQIAELVEGEVIGDASVQITGINMATEARAGDLTFAENEKYLTAANASQAAAIIVPEAVESSKTLIKVANPKVAFARILQTFAPEPTPPAGIHPSAVVDPSASVDPSAHVGPQCTIEAGATIGKNCVLRGNVHIGANVSIGPDTRIFPNVTIYPGATIGERVRIHSGTTIGADGYGYVFDGKEHVKIPQIGSVEIGDDVEIGANTTIDRGALGTTRIGKGTRIDNQVQIAHNVEIGEHCLIVAQVGIAGSTKLGNFVTIAGQAGLTHHVSIGDGAVIGGGAAVINDIPAGEKWWGIPAQPQRNYKRTVIALQKLPQLLKRVSALEAERGE